MKYPRTKLFMLALTIGMLAGSKTSRAQNFSISFDRVVSAETSGEGVNYDTYDSGNQSIEDNATNGVFNHSLDQQATLSGESVHTICSQNTLLTNTDTTLTISGTLSSMDTSSGGVTKDSMGIGYSGGNSKLYVLFYTQQPLNFTLSTSINYHYEGDTNPEDGHEAFLQFYSTDGNDTNHVYQFGNPPPYYTYGETPYAFSGTNSGVLPAGGYTLEVEIGWNVGWNSDANNTVGAYSYLNTNNITFSLIASVPPVPPVIQSLTPLIPGLFQINWTAPQDGNYQILSSSDLVHWSQSVAPAFYSSGTNSTEVNGVSATQGFYQIQYVGAGSGS